MFGETASDQASAPWTALMGTCCYTSLGSVIPASSLTQVQRRQFSPRNAHPLPTSLVLLRFLPKSRPTPADAFSNRMPVRRSLFPFSSSTKTRPSPGADRLRAARVYLWALSPLSYLSALTTNPVELRARRGRCRFGPPATFTCSQAQGGQPPGKSPHGVYRHELDQNSTEKQIQGQTGRGRSSSRRWPAQIRRCRSS